MGYIFISYSHKDKAYVHQLRAALQRKGFEVWIDDRIDYGKRWPKVIQDKLDACEALIVVVSENSADSEWVQSELTRAQRKGKPIFPLLLGGEIWIALETTQYVDVTGGRLPPDKFYEQLEKEAQERAAAEEARRAAAEQERQRKDEWERLRREAPEKQKPVLAEEPARPPARRAIPVEIGGRKSGFSTFGTASSLLTALIFLLACGIGIYLLVKNLSDSPAAPAVTEPARTPFITWSTLTPTSPPATPTLTAGPTDQPQSGDIWTSPVDGMDMVYVPAGEFTMGSERYDDEKPIHKVSLDGFWIDQTEVTNGMYALCVDAGECDPPAQSQSYTHSSYYGDADFADYPVMYVSWNDASAYCKWAGRRLPTEAEWEKAARGVDGRTYPWGEGIDCQRANYTSSCVGDTTKVGSYPSSASPYGALDMAGNVWEWTADWYDAYPGNTVSDSDYGTIYRVLRGGSWNVDDGNTRSANRDWYTPTDSSNYLGFRCARGTSP